MNTEEYGFILRFLTFQEYPLHILQDADGKKQCHAKSNFRRLANQYQVCEGKLFKVWFFRLHTEILFSEICYKTSFSIRMIVPKIMPSLVGG